MDTDQTHKPTHDNPDQSTGGTINPFRPHEPVDHRRTALLAALIVAGFALAVALAYPLDTPFGDRVQQIAAEDTMTRIVVKQPRRLFEWPVIVGLVVTLALFPNRRELLIGFGAALGSCMGAVHLVKWLVGRARPNLELGTDYFVPFGDPVVHLDSFPSGTSAQAFVLAILMSIYVPKARYVAIPAAVCTALSRVVQDRHFLTDLIGGLGFAVMAVYLCYRLLGPRFYPELDWSTFAKRHRHPARQDAAEPAP